MSNATPENTNQIYTLIGALPPRCVGSNVNTACIGRVQATYSCTCIHMHVWGFCQQGPREAYAERGYGADFAADGCYPHGGGRHMHAIRSFSGPRDMRRIRREEADAKLGRGGKRERVLGCLICHYGDAIRRGVPGLNSHPRLMTLWPAVRRRAVGILPSKQMAGTAFAGKKTEGSSARSASLGHEGLRARPPPV